MQLFKTIFFLPLLASTLAFAADAPPTETSPYINQGGLISEMPEKILPTITPPPYRSPTAAALLSSLFPGLGHVYLGDLKTAGGFLAATSLSISTANASDRLTIPSGVILQNTWLYSIFAAYRDARIFNNDIGARCKMPMETLSDLSYAPFQWSVMKKPEVWGGVLGSLAVALTISQFAAPRRPHNDPIPSDAWSPLLAFPIGIGEEAFFRGYVQSHLAEKISPWGAIITSSALFAAAHIGNAQYLHRKDRWRYYTFILPFIGSVGAYKGWLTYKNQSLRESVAVHSWYDFTLFALSSLASSSVVGKPRVSAALAF